MRVPWTARRSNLSILKEISPGCSLEGLMLKLKLQYFVHLMRRADSLEKTLIKVKEETEKVGLKLNIQKTKIMASGSIISWEIYGETVADFIFWGSRIAGDGDCSHEIKRCYSLEGKL